MFNLIPLMYQVRLGNLLIIHLRPRLSKFQRQSYRRMLRNPVEYLVNVDTNKTQQKEQHVEAKKKKNVLK